MRKLLLSILLVGLFLVKGYCADNAIVWDDVARKYKVSQPLGAGQGGTATNTTGTTGVPRVVAGGWLFNTTQDQVPDGTTYKQYDPTNVAISGGNITIAGASSHIDASLIDSGIVPTARIDTGTTAGKIVVLDGSAKLPPVDGSALTGLSSVTQVNDVETTGVTVQGGFGEYTILSVAKTITSGKTVLLTATGYYAPSGSSEGYLTIFLKNGSTVSQTLVVINPNSSSKGGSWACSAIVTGLSGSVTFSVTGQGNTTNVNSAMYGNLEVLEF